MRQPKPRFDVRRSAWVTNAGGRLKTLHHGPKNAETEAAAQAAFYRHMAQPGSPVKAAAVQITLGELADEYAEWMEKQVAAGEMTPATQADYERFIQKFIDRVNGRRPAAALLPIDLERYRTNRHSVQTDTWR